MHSKSWLTLGLASLLSLQSVAAQAASLDPAIASAPHGSGTSRPPMRFERELSEDVTSWGQALSLSSDPSAPGLFLAVNGPLSEQWASGPMRRSSGQASAPAASNDSLWFATTLPWVIPAYALSIVGMWGVIGCLFVYPTWAASRLAPNADHAALDRLAWTYALATLGSLGMGFGMVSVTNAAMARWKRGASEDGKERLAGPTGDSIAATTR